MTIKIECEPADLAYHLYALGYVPRQPEFDEDAVEESVTRTSIPTDVWRKAAERAEIISEAHTGVEQSTETETDTLQREPGKPAPGKKRRTNAEIAEDEAYFAANPQGDKPAISTGENRVGPDDGADEQDDADEAAETAANKGGLTRDDLRAAHGRYQKAFGIPHAVANFRALIGGAIADIPETEEALSAAIAKVDAAIAEAEAAPHEPAETAAEDAGDIFGEKPEPAPLTKMDIVEAMRDYAGVFDNERADTTKMTHTTSDIPRLLASAFGNEVRTPKAVPDDQKSIAKAVEVIRSAIKHNPFERERIGQ